MFVLLFSFKIQRNNIKSLSSVQKIRNSINNKQQKQNSNYYFVFFCGEKRRSVRDEEKVRVKEMVKIRV